MFKLKIVSLSLGICLLVFPSFLFADETLTITTYYPSPYGSYNQLTTASNTYLAYSSGSVGIGTTGPDSKLTVSANAGYLQELLHLINTNSINLSNFRIYNEPDGAGGHIIFNGKVVSTTNGDLISGSSTINSDHGSRKVGVLTYRGATTDADAGFNFMTANSGTGATLYSRMFINHAGNVGVGSANLDQRLNVYKSGAGNSVIKIKADQNNYPNGGINDLGSLTFGVDGDIASSPVVGKIRAFQSSGKYGLMFSYYGASLTDGMILDGNGYVGIGTTAPGQKLSVNGNIELQGTAGNTRYIITDESGTGTSKVVMQAGFGSGSAGGAINLYANTHAAYPGSAVIGLSNNSSAKFRVNTSGLDGGTDLFTVLETGNVGIGTASPGYKFQVYIDASNEGHVDSTGAWQRSSDIRYKKNVSDLQDGLAKIMNLRPVRYDSKTEPDSKGSGKHLGFIAQEFEKAVPELVSTDNRGYKSIAYGDLTIVLTKAIQEQQKKIEEQESQIQKQEKDIEYLKQELIGSTAMLIESNKNLKANTKEIQDLKAEIVSLEKKF